LRVKESRLLKFVVKLFERTLCVRFLLPNGFDIKNLIDNFCGKVDIATFKNCV